MARPHKKHKDELTRQGFTSICSKCGRRSAKDYLVFVQCYYCDLGNAQPKFPTKKRRIFKKNKS